MATRGDVPNAHLGGSKDRFWIPRFWDGMSFSAWLQLLVRNRFAVSLHCLPMVCTITLLAVFNSLLACLQRLRFGRKIAATEIREEPIFIIGHWRAGTTLLHELLVLDPRHTFPDTCACFAPNHFLVSSWFIKRCLNFLLPERRPMDNMATGWDRPQEDEFALCNMGVPSPYLTLAFPNHPPHDPEYLDLTEVPPEELSRWKAAMRQFLQSVTVANPKRIVLKSPPHTARLRVLLEMFPKARFIHIVRDPFVVFPSTVNLWKRLYRDQGLHTPRCEGLEEYVLKTFRRMYAAFDAQRDVVPPGHLCEIRYEDLVADPLGQMERVYDELGLGGFETVRPALEAHLAGQAGYRTNRYPLDDALRARIAKEWAPFMERYGYAPQCATD